MPGATLVRRGQYHDSVFLMRVANKIAGQPGVTAAAAVMATDANKQLLREAAFDPPDASAAGPNDLVVGVQAERAETIEAVLARLDEWLRPEPPAPGTRGARSLVEAHELLPDANVVLISVPGQYAAREARRAIERGLSVFLFSDNVPLEQEVELKRLAAERGVVVMGPDCGTAIVAGVGLGFANAVRRGPIGVVGASGTGIQEVTTLIHRAGSGVSHAIGTGSRDPSNDVGGPSTLAGIDALERDAATQAIVVVSKPPGPSTRARLEERIARAAKPVVACFLGSEGGDRGARWSTVATLDEAADAAIAAVGARGASARTPPTDPAPLRARLAHTQRDVRGLFAGGSLCYQAQHIFRRAGVAVRSNAPIDPASRLDGRVAGHVLLDLGGDEFTRGRPHPMIDARLRRERIVAEAEDPATAVILLDVLLGYAVAPDPGGDLVHAIVRARDTARSRGGDLVVIASVTGTDADPQGLDRQTSTLRAAGTVVCASAAEAARLALAVVA